MLIVRSATTTIASQTKVHIKKDLRGKNMPIVLSATTTIASQIKIESPLAFGPSDHQPFIGILRLLESSQYRNQLSIGATLIEMVFLDGSSPAMSRFKHVQFNSPPGCQCSQATINNQPVASFSSKCFDASTFASSTATKSQNDCDNIPTARNQFKQQQQCSLVNTTATSPQRSTNAAQAKPVSWNLTQSQVLQTLRMHCATSDATGFFLKRSFEAKQLQHLQVSSSQQIPHQLNRSLISLHLFLTAKTQHCQTSNGHKRSVNKSTLIT